MLPTELHGAFPACQNKCSCQWPVSSRASFGMGKMFAPGHWLSWGKEGPVPTQKRQTKGDKANHTSLVAAEAREQAGLLA